MEANNRARRVRSSFVIAYPAVYFCYIFPITHWFITLTTYDSRNYYSRLTSYWIILRLYVKDVDKAASYLIY